MKKIVLSLMILSLLCGLFAVVSACAEEDDWSYAVVKNPKPNDRLHLRIAPSSSATSLGKYYSGVRVQVLDGTHYDKWVKVYIGNPPGGLTGYMLHDYLVFLDWAYVTPQIPTFAIKQPDGLVLRAGQTNSSVSLGSYPYGTAVEVLGIGSKWHHVRIGDKTGFMQASGLKEQNESSLIPSTTGSENASSAIVPDAIGYVYNGNGKRLNLRAAPRSDASSLGLYYTGCPVVVLEYPSNGWVKVRIGNVSQGSRYGYMMTEYLQFGNVSSSVKNALPTIINTSSARDIYDQPYLTEIEQQNVAADYKGWYQTVGYRTDFEVLGVLEQGWLHVRVNLGQEGNSLDTGMPLAGTTGFIDCPTFK